MKDKILAIEFLKFIAALMITNSHFKPLYPEAISALGTFGAPGNALFFFASGYVLSLGKLNTNGINWYKKRIKRLWPTTLVWNTFFSYLIFNTSLSFAGVWLGGGAWFVHCIAIYYILYYFVRKLKLIRFSIIFSFIFSIISLFTVGLNSGSVIQLTAYWLSLHIVTFRGTSFFMLCTACNIALSSHLLIVVSLYPLEIKYSFPSSWIYTPQPPRRDFHSQLPSVNIVISFLSILSTSLSVQCPSNRHGLPVRQYPC